MKNIILGVKKFLEVPSLPPVIYNFYSHIFTRIFRFVGGICVLIVLTKGLDYVNLHNYFSELISLIIAYAINFYAVFFIIFTVIINLIKIFYTIYLIIKKPEIFEIRNSPLNIFATKIAQILSCIKIGCIASGSTAAIVAGGVTFDALIEKTGRAPIFIPMMAEGINFILGEPVSPSNVKLPETSNSSSDGTMDTDFSQEAISDALNKYQSLSLTEKESF